MSIESGGDEGQNRARKANQVGGSGAKHAYGDCHPLSNRAERRSAKQSLEHGTGRTAARSLKKGKNKDRIPSRKHLLDRLAVIDKGIVSVRDWLSKNRKLTQEEVHEYPGLIRYCGYNYHTEELTSLNAKRAKLLAEFTKHGYKAP